MAEKTEYKSKLDEIEDLIARGRSDEGLMMLEAMNFRKVKNEIGRASCRERV